MQCVRLSVAEVALKDTWVVVVLNLGSVQAHPVQDQMLLLNTARINRRLGEFYSVCLMLTFNHRDLTLSDHQR